jgi:hypothetical protein
MVEVLEFVFTSFWTWAGTVILVATFGASFAQVFNALRGR